MRRLTWISRGYLRRLSVMVIVWLALMPALRSAYPQSPVGGQADDRSAPVDFGKDVWPLLKRACIECHGPQKAEGDLRLDRGELFLSRREIVEKGNASAGELLRRIQLPAGDAEIMPARGQPLTASQIALLKRWVAAGAAWPENVDQQKHWAYVAPTRPAIPEVQQHHLVKTPVDSFVLAQLESRGWTMSPRAPSEKLIRRLFLDMIGLPPTIEEIRQFSANPNEEAYLKLVDDLMDRPQFGERWARPWLDAARYADSHGFQKDNLRDMWAYRDWVIRALNEDLPFDQFTIEQIAGDLLPNASESQKIATGFHRSTPTNVEAGSLPEETRIEQVIDRVNTTGSVWLGTTLECCQCHDHKYDPFTQKEYYQLLAFFNSTEQEADRTNPKSPSSIEFKGPALAIADVNRDAARKKIEDDVQQLQQRLSSRRKKMSEDLAEWAGSFRQQVDQASKIHSLKIGKFTSQGTTDSIERLPDGAILIKGDDPPGNDTYEAHCQVAAKAVRAFRIDVLRHADLPGMGPGRGDRVRRNFVLNDLSVQLKRATDGSLTRLKFVSARASFSQKGRLVSDAIDDSPSTGWAISPEFNTPHWAVFVLDQPVDLDMQDELIFTLEQNYGQARTIGCFRLSALTGNVEGDAVPEQLAAILAKDPNDWDKNDRRILLDKRLEADNDFQKLQTRVDRLKDQLQQFAPMTTQVMVELAQPRDTHMFERGDYRKPGDAVQPATPATLHPLPASGRLNRLDLARWLVSRDNPLVARVTVNRWWAELFGAGLVNTLEDFGSKGDPATHPELLDWLACEFMDNGWSMKKLIRTIVTSATYQQSSNMSSEQRQLDPLNTFLARGASFRMDAEMIRDHALTVAGLINLKQFGPPVRPYQPDGIWKKVGGTAYTYEVSTDGDQHRRGLYVVLKRGTPYPSFVNFDATARLACTLKRSRTNTPVQALTLLNDPVYVEAAQSLAQRVQRELPDAAVPEWGKLMFQLCTGREPSSQEQETLTNFLAQELQQTAATVTSSQGSLSSANQRALASLATVVLNLHETITKD